MSFDVTAFNRRHYRRADWAADYFSSGLRPAETMILVKYRDEVAAKRVLELECGAGRMSRYIARLTLRATGLTFLPELVEQSRAAIPGMEFQQGDVRDLGRFRAGTFDTVFFPVNVLDSLSHNDRMKVHGEVHRVLNPGGLWIFSSHNRRFREAGAGPRLELSLNPATMFRRVLTYARALRNRGALRGRELREPEFAILNDVAHEYSMLQYHIDRASQGAQLERAGFVLMETYGEDGRMLGPSEDDSHWATLYHVARRA